MEERKHIFNPGNDVFVVSIAALEERSIFMSTLLVFFHACACQTFFRTTKQIAFLAIQNNWYLSA